MKNDFDIDMKNISILLVEDSPSMARLYIEYLKKGGYDSYHVETGEEALELVDKLKPSLILLDIQLPGISGVEVLHKLKQSGYPAAVIMITAHGSIKIAVESIREGAFDFLVKPFTADRLITTVKNALSHNRLQAIADFYNEDISREGFYGFIGSSLVMQGIYRIIESAAASKATVFITGESGTGKEVCADAIHQHSGRKDNKMIAINCAAIPHDLMESELFGHKKGAFTGADSAREGAIMLADGGTLFLDEICEMAPDLQTKLLRFLQTGQIQPVGGNLPISVDVRIICATNRDPFTEVKAGNFREDLYYRLHVIPIELPPLAEREDDVIEIAKSFLHDFSKEESKEFKILSPEVVNIFKNYDWSGNIRELQNILRNIVVLHDGEEVTIDMLPAPLDDIENMNFQKKDYELSNIEELNIFDLDSRRLPKSPTEIPSLAIIERRIIEVAIAVCDDNISKAAAVLEVNPSTLYRKISNWQDDDKIKSSIPS